ncbi:hypothetical protein GF377_09475 [candidate division GN15 bacterium]|nr:hypothetical protein [candidate division GN15 bacterium]
MYCAMTPSHSPAPDSPRHRFFRHYAADPHFNMGFDEWMFRYCHQHAGTVLARLYAWRVGTITFGLNQRQRTAYDADRLGDTPVIRRATGGRAVYHDPSEVTYAIAVNPHDSPLKTLGGSVSATYARLADALQLFLSRLGMVAEIVAGSQPQAARPEVFHKAPCFASSARRELVAEGRKIIASAQRQVDGVVLQHGSIKLAGLAAHPALGMIAAEASDADLQQIEDKEFDRLAGHFRASVEAGLGVRFDTGGVVSEEQTAIDAVVAWVRKNPLARRDPIKQTTSAKSL